MVTRRLVAWRGARIEEFATPAVRFGRFTCAPDALPFHTASQSGPDALMVFPTVPVGVRHEGETEIVANRHTVILRDPGQAYRLRALSAQGDVCTWIAIPAPLLEQLGSRIPFPTRRVWLGSRGFLRQRRSLHLAMQQPSPLAAEEAVVAVVDLCLRARPATSSGRAVARAAERLLSARFTERLHLHDIARAIGCSPWHLARAFKTEVGTTLHRYRDQLRLRTAVDRLQDPATDLTTLALELGYASHSHLTGRFRDAFGVPPSAVRATLAPQQQESGAPEPSS